MEIRWLGQSAFEIKTSAGTLISDPYPGLFEAVAARDPNTVVTSCKKGRRAGEIPDADKVLDRPGEYEFGGLGVRGVGTPGGGPDRSRTVNTVFLVDAEGVTVGILGLAGAVPNEATLHMMGPVDVLLVRTDSPAMPFDQLAAAVRAIDPKLVIASGFDPASGAPAAGLAAFLKQMGVKAVEPQPRQSISKSSLPQDMKVVVLSPRG
jgi:L-ascorbate metabolism protein UlaG (beta-lactamase superfamily)